MAVKALRKPTDKQLLWFSYYTDRENDTTFLRSTRSAMAAYNNDNYNSARQCGVENKKALADHISQWLDEEGFSETALKSRIRGLMNAKDTKFIKIQGAVKLEDLPDGASIVCTSGKIKTIKDDEGKDLEVYGAGETLVALRVEDKTIQRQGIDMGVKVKGMYAADRLEVSGLDGLAGRLERAAKRSDGEEAGDGGDSLFD